MSDHRIVVIDNYDSYVYNLFQMIGELTGREATVFRNDRTTVAAIAALQPTHIVISPGPGSPEDPRYFGVGLRVIIELGRHVPTLGVCLGQQGIGYAFGGRVVRAPRAMHGKTSVIRHDGRGIFAGVPNPCEVMRYHSLVVDPGAVPAELRVTATTDDGVIMALEHREHPIVGVQFHPESIGTRDGRTMLANFLGVRGATAARDATALPCLPRS